MTTIVSNPTSVTVNSLGASVLRTLAASMPVGSWAQLTPANQNAVLGVGKQSGTVLHYCNKMPWNPKSKRIEVVAMDHNWGSVRYAQYDEASNQFVLVTSDVGFGNFTQHGYDHSAVNPYTGDLYHRRAGVYGGTTLTVARKPLSSSIFADLPNATSNYVQIAIGTCWWSGAFAGAGSQGCLIVFNSGDSFGKADDGQILAYDPLTNSWFLNKKGMAPHYATGGTNYHSVMDYSAKKNVAVYGGGNDAPTKLWRLNSDASFTSMPDVPSGASVGIQRGNLVCDPVTGNFLLFSAGKLWELNPTGAGTWTVLSGSRTPPSGVGSPGPNDPQGVVSCGIPEYGVVAYITQPSSIDGTFFLYKHA